MIKVSEIQVKDLFTKSKLPDADYVCNPYQGCPHKCIYCYAEFMKRFCNHNEEWGDFLDVKKVSSIRLPKVDEKQTILLSSVTDPYNPFERKYESTRTILKELVGTSGNIEILTKSELVVRDIDILKELKHIKVGISINIMDDSIRRDIEPFASSIEKRIEALKILKQEKIPTYAFVSPLFPEISDYELIIKELYKYTDYMCFENLNLRGSYKTRVFKYIEKTRQDLMPLYKDIYVNKNMEYWEEVKDKICNTCNLYGVTYRIYFYHDKIKKK